MVTLFSNLAGGSTLVGYAVHLERAFCMNIGQDVSNTVKDGMEGGASSDELFCRVIMIHNLKGQRS